MNNPIAENVLGTLGAVCWSIQVSRSQPIFEPQLTLTKLLPQIVINYKRHNTEGLQGSMMLLWAVAGVPLGVYNIVEEFNVALRIQPQILTTLSLLTWAQCLYYGKVILDSNHHFTHIQVLIISGILNSEMHCCGRPAFAFVRRH